MHRSWWMGPLWEGEPAAAGGGTGVLPPPPARDPERDRLAADLARERDNNARLTAALGTRTAPPAAAPPVDNTLRDLNKKFYENPVGHSVTIAQEAARTILAEQAQHQHPTLVMAARNQIRATNPELFDRYAADIDAKVGSLAPQWATNATVWGNAFTQVKGEKMEEIVAARQAALPPDTSPQAPALHISNGGGPARPSAPPAPGSKGPKLNDQEKEWAARFEMKEEDYARSRDRTFEQEAVNPLNSMKKMSFFDGAITFNSQQKRKDQRDARKRAAAAAAK
jgi:hypothetical protein